jgi:hypothetical protein
MKSKHNFFHKWRHELHHPLKRSHFLQVCGIDYYKQIDLSHVRNFLKPSVGRIVD